MTNTVADRRRARMVDNLKKAELALLEAKIEAPGASSEKTQRAIDNALVATRYAMNPRSGKVVDSPKEPA